MTGRFVVTKELLELSLAANQNMEMSENLDDDEAFKTLLSDSLAKMNRQSRPCSGLPQSDSVTKSHQVESLINSEKLNNQDATILETGWMNFRMNKPV